MLVIFISLAQVSVASPSGYSKENDLGEHNVTNYRSPCGKEGLDLDSVTLYFQITFDAVYKDFTEEEIEHFLEKIGQKDSRIVHVRVFRSAKQEQYAVVSSWMFRNYLNDKPLVELLCVEKLNGSAALFYSTIDFSKMMGGKVFYTIGEDE